MIECLSSSFNLALYRFVEILWQAFALRYVGLFWRCQSRVRIRRRVTLVIFFFISLHHSSSSTSVCLCRCLSLDIFRSLLYVPVIVGHGGALVEAITLNRRVVGSTPALAAM